MKQKSSQVRLQENRSLYIDGQLQGSLLSVVAHFDTVALVICDDSLRFRAVNDAWAAMHRVKREDHLGVTIREALGSAAKHFELIFQTVFSTGKPILNHEISASLPTRNEESYWITSCFPVQNPFHREQLVAAAILETTQFKVLEVWARNLLTDSVRLLEALIESKELLDGTSPKADITVSSMQRQKEVSTRERQVIHCLVQSKTNKEVAAALGISPRTVETYRSRIMLKLRLRTLTELVHYAIRNGIVPS